MIDLHYTASISQHHTPVLLLTIEMKHMRTMKNYNITLWMSQNKTCFKITAKGTSITGKYIPEHDFCGNAKKSISHFGLRMPRHLFQARTPSQNSTNHRADGLCINMVCEYFCWMVSDPHFFFSRSLPFQIISIILKHTKKSVRGKF